MGKKTLNKIDKVKELSDFQKKLEGKTFEELKKMEEEIIEKANKIDNEVAKAEFDLPEKNYETVAKAVKYFLNKESVQWQYTLGMHVMYDFWDENKKPKTIPYPQLDSILRTLGKMQFTGNDEWCMVIAINKYFEPLHKAFAETTDKVYTVASKHNAIMDALEKTKPIGDVSVDIPKSITVEQK